MSLPFAESTSGSLEELCSYSYSSTVKSTWKDDQVLYHKSCVPLSAVSWLSSVHPSPSDVKLTDSYFHTTHAILSVKWWPRLTLNSHHLGYRWRKRESKPVIIGTAEGGHIQAPHGCIWRQMHQTKATKDVQLLEVQDTTAGSTPIHGQTYHTMHLIHLDYCVQNLN